MSRIGCALALLCLLSTAMFGQAGNNNFFIGGTYNKATLVAGDKTTLYGWKASVEKKLKPWLSLVGEANGGYGHHTYIVPAPLCPATVCGNGSVEVRATEYDFLAGPRVSGNAGEFRIFGHVLFGVGRINGDIKSPSTSSTSNTAFAADIGGGADYHLKGPLAWRIQADFLQTQFYSTAQHDARYSTGLVIRF
jgi:hypothetical protein